MRLRVGLISSSDSVMMCIACGDKSQRLPGSTLVVLPFHLSAGPESTGSGGIDTRSSLT